MLHAALALGQGQTALGPLGKEGNRKKSRLWQGPKPGGRLSGRGLIPRRPRILIHG